MRAEAEARFALEKFFKLYGYGGESPSVFFAPGRVNLIGDHTDYNGGYVFPMALEYGTYAVIRRRPDKRVFLHSTNVNELVEVDTAAIQADPKTSWANYPKGVIKVLLDAGYNIGGAEMLFYGNLPLGAGLSSSASMEVVTALALSQVFGLHMKPADMAVLCKRAENDFVGVNCGIMDQFASAMSKQGFALLLKSDTLEYEHVPLNLQGYAVVVVNTNKKRNLVDSAYNERRRECEQALSFLKRVLPIQNLAQITPGEFALYGRLIPDEVLRKRARHVITENRRVLQAVQALKSGDLKRFGELMVQSHSSLKFDFEVSCSELDLLVELALSVKGVVGTRMTGAGFGGCTVSIVQEDALAEFKNVLATGYARLVGFTPSIYVTKPAHGARQVLL